MQMRQTKNIKINDGLVPFYTSKGLKTDDFISEGYKVKVSKSAVGENIIVPVLHSGNKFIAPPGYQFSDDFSDDFRIKGL